MGVSLFSITLARTLRVTWTRSIGLKSLVVGAALEFLKGEKRETLQNLSRRVTAKSFPSPPSAGHQVAGPLGATSFGLIFAFLPTIDK